MSPSPPSRKGFTLIEVSLAIALIAVGLTVAVLVYNEYTTWAQANADRENARNLVAAVAHYRVASNRAIVDTGFVVGPVTTTRAQIIYDQIASGTGLPGGVMIVPPGYRLPSGVAFPVDWNESASGVFAPIPSN